MEVVLKKRDIYMFVVVLIFIVGDFVFGFLNDTKPSQYFVDAPLQIAPLAVLKILLDFDSFQDKFYEECFGD